MAEQIKMLFEVNCPWNIVLDVGLDPLLRGMGPVLNFGTPPPICGTAEAGELKLCLRTDGWGL